MAIGFTAEAHQPVDGTIHAGLGVFSYMTQQLDHGFHSPLMSGPGLVVDGDLNKHGGLEVSMFYMRSVYSLRRDGYSVTEQAKRIQIGMGYRHWFTRKNGLALAFTSQYSMGDAAILSNSFPTTNPPATSARDITEYGFEASFQHEPITYKKFSLVLDARYNYSVTAKKREDANHYGLLVMLKYFVQSREKPIPSEI